MTLNKFIIYYTSILFLLLQAHIFFLYDTELNSDLIYKSYFFFYLFSIFFFLSIYLKTKKNAQITNVFFFGSTLKITLFFFIFRPVLYQNNQIGEPQISIFLVPYIFSSVFIVYCFSKRLLNPT